MSLPRLWSVCLLALASCRAAQAQGKTENIIFVMTDGLRWQEVFQGADAALMNDKQREAPPGNRAALLPFLWKVVARQGQIFGNRALGSDAFVTNGLNFSYPGYNETLCGFVDPGIKSNDDVPNPNVTVLEWLHQKAAYRGKVAAFGAWAVISSIVNARRAGFVANSGYH